MFLLSLPHASHFHTAKELEEHPTKRHKIAPRPQHRRKCNQGGTGGVMVAVVIPDRATQPV